MPLTGIKASELSGQPRGSDIAGVRPSTGLWACLGYFLFFLMVTFPAAPGLGLLKGCLLALVLASVVVVVPKGSFALDFTVVAWTFFFVALGFLLVVRGLFEAAPGAWKVVTVHVLWPIIYLVLLGGVASFKKLVDLERVLMLAAIFIPAYGFLYVASEMDLVPGIGYIGLSSFRDEQALGLYDNYIQTSIHGLNSMSFLLPFIMATLVTYRRSEKSERIWRISLWISLLLGIALMLISGRRALLLVTMLAPLLILGFCFFQPFAQRIRNQKFVLRLAVVALCSAIALTFVISLMHEVKLTQIFGELANSFDFSATTESGNASDRRSQYFALLHGWHENSIIGAGLGMPAYGSIRSETTPWAYELTYLALLFQTGLVGVLAYAAGVFWIYRLGTRVIKEGGILGQMMLPLLVGMTCFLIANATNPYLTKFDGLWTLFLPVAVINFWLVGHRERESSSPRAI